MSEKKTPKDLLVDWAVAMEYFPTKTAARKVSIDALKALQESHVAKLQALDAESVPREETIPEKIERLKAKLATLRGVDYATRKRTAIEKQIRKLARQHQAGHTA